MAASATIQLSVVLYNENAETAKDKYLDAWDNPRTAAEKLIDLLSRLASGSAVGKLISLVDAADGTAASNGAIACTQASVSAGDYVDVGDCRFTVSATPSDNPADGEFAAGASDTACGDNLAAAINAHPKLANVLTAANTTGSVALTMIDKGIQGNLMRLAKSGSGFALTQPSNGAVGTLGQNARTYRYGA